MYIAVSSQDFHVVLSDSENRGRWIGRQIGEGSHEGGTGDKREANAVVVEGDQLG